jgi:DNA replication protein DnaD
MYEAGESSRGGKPNLNYLKTIAEHWIKDGIYTRAEAKRRREADKPNLKIVPPKQPDTPEARRNRALQDWMNSGGDPSEFRYDASNS